MTAHVYCKKDIDEWGDYKPYDCPKLYNNNNELKDDYELICFKCRFYIEEGKDIPC